MTAERHAPLWSSWLQLLRIPNHLTVPGDLLAGAALAGGLRQQPPWPALVGVVTASLLLYSGGMLLNDWFDRAVDAEERPERPIPSGAVGAMAVLTAGLAALAAGVGLALLFGLSVGLIAAALAGLVVLYDGGAKRWPPLGVTVMGGCRAVNLLLGAAAVGEVGSWPEFLWLAAGVHLAYVVLVSLVAVNEVTGLPPKPVVILLGLTPLAAVLAGVNGLRGDIACLGAWVTLVLLATNMLVLCSALWRVREPGHTGRLVGWLLRHLIFVQAFWVAAGGGSCLVVAAVLLLWPGSVFLGRWFYSS